MVIITVMTVLAVLVCLSLAQNWSIEATAKLQAAIMLVLLALEAVAAYLMLQWKQPETLPQMPPKIQQSSKLSEIGYPRVKSALWNPALETKAMPPQSPLVQLVKNDAPVNLSRQTRYAKLSTRRVSYLCILDHSCETRMTPNEKS
jgi:hypothetical protein